MIISATVDFTQKNISMRQVKIQIPSSKGNEATRNDTEKRLSAILKHQFTVRVCDGRTTNICTLEIRYTEIDEDVFCESFFKPYLGHL